MHPFPSIFPTLLSPFLVAAVHPPSRRYCTDVEGRASLKGSGEGGRTPVPSLFANPVLQYGVYLCYISFMTLRAYRDILHQIAFYTFSLTCSSLFPSFFLSSDKLQVSCRLDIDHPGPVSHIFHRQVRSYPGCTKSIILVELGTASNGTHGSRAYQQAIFAFQAKATKHGVSYLSGTRPQIRSTTAGQESSSSPRVLFSASVGYTNLEYLFRIQISGQQWERPHPRRLGDAGCEWCRTQQILRHTRPRPGLASRLCHSPSMCQTLHRRAGTIDLIFGFGTSLFFLIYNIL